MSRCGKETARYHQDEKHNQRMVPVSDGSPANPDEFQTAPNQRDQDRLRYTQEELQEIGDMLSDLDRTRLSPGWHSSGEDWHAVFNPNVMRRLDVNLVHDFDHNSVVCCVRFSPDGNYLATGCDRSAQIFDVVTGGQVCHLSHGSTQRRSSRSCAQTSLRGVRSSRLGRTIPNSPSIQSRTKLLARCLILRKSAIESLASSYRTLLPF